MTREETKLMLDRIAQRHDLRVVDADYMKDQQALIDELKMAIQMVYWHNINTCKHYQYAGRRLSSLKSAEALEFASKALGLLEANDNILRVLNERGMKDILVMPKNNGRSEMNKASEECLDVIKCPE